MLFISISCIKDKIFEHLEQKVLSEKDKELLLTMLEKCPEPNQALKNTYKKISAMHKYLENGQEIQQVPESIIELSTMQSK